MIAGTTFLLCDLQEELPDHQGRVMRSKIGAAGLRRLTDAVAAGTTLALKCEDGLVLITLRCDGRETIALVELAVSTSSKVAAFKRQEPAMLAVARDAGADRLVFSSHRRGWARLLGPQWQRIGDTFSRSV